MSERQLIKDAIYKALTPMLARIRELEKRISRLENKVEPKYIPTHKTEPIDSPNGSHGTLHIRDEPE